MPYLGHLKYVTTAPWPRHPNSHNSASCGTVGPQYHSALFLNCSHELLLHSLCCASRGLATRAAPLSSTLLNLFSFSCAFPFSGCAGLFFYNGHSLHLCPSSPHLKHFTPNILTLLIVFSSTPHCITLLLNTSNLFWGTTVPFVSPLLFLQFRARCPNFLQHRHNFPFLPSNSALNLARAHFSLSRLLISWLYCV